MIPTKPPPTFRDSDRWSSQFIDFVSRCLVKTPESRATASELLHSDYISTVEWETEFWPTYRFFLCLSNYFTLFLAATKVTLWAKIFAHLRFRVLLHDGTVEWMYPVLESISDKLQHPIPKIFYWEIAFTTTVETNRKIYLILTETNTLKSYVCVFILITCKKYIYVSLRIKVITLRGRIEKSINIFQIVKGYSFHS